MSNILNQPVVDVAVIEVFHTAYEHFCFEAEEARKTGNKNLEHHFRCEAKRIAMRIPRRTV